MSEKIVIKPGSKMREIPMESNNLEEARQDERMEALYLGHKLEKLRSEFKAMLNVLEARAGSAEDFEDWDIITNQAKRLAKLAQSIRNIARP